jgi:uncharacterized protein YybS (DUF2232 family)
LFAAYLAIPPLGIVSGVLAPFPAAYNRLVHGRTSSLIVIFGTAAAVTALFGIFAGCLYLGMCGVTGFLMPELLLRGAGGSRALFWTTAANLVIFAAGFVIYSSQSGIDLQRLISMEISESLKQAVAIYEKAGVKGDELDLLKRSMATGADMLKQLYPALFSSVLIVVGGCNLVLLKRTTRALAINMRIGDFASYKNSDLLVWVLIAAGASLLLPPSQVTTPALNILFVVSLLYFFQGMAVITALLKKGSVSALVRIIFYTMLIIQPYLLALVACIGLFDLWVDFRTPKKQENL